MSARDDWHALAWQATGEVARQLALAWVSAASLPEGHPVRADLARAVVFGSRMLELQDQALAMLVSPQVAEESER